MLAGTLPSTGEIMKLELAAYSASRALCFWIFSGTLCLLPRLGLADDSQEIAKQAQNPVASLISIPFQNNLNFGVGPQGREADVLDIEPVIPFHPTEDWNVITRTILPVVSQPYLGPNVGKTTGTGDVNLSLYLSPAHVGSLIWGIGPSFTLPTASEHSLGQGRYSAGLSAVMLTIQGPWLTGVLVTDVASVGGETTRANVDQILIEPFANYNFPHGWYLTTSPIITANWKASASDRWTVPVGGGGGKLFRIGKQAINAYVQGFGNIVQAHEAGTWTLRIQVQLLFPK